MNLKEIQEMIKLMQESGITEFQLERNGFKILLKRGQGEGQVMGSAPSVSNAPMGPESYLPQKEGPADGKKTLIEITSPMVGTFYASPSPDSAPYIQQGQEIHIGDVVCIVEAMKVMNEIKAEVAGIAVEILVENGQPIEFGQPLFRLKPM